MTGGVGGVWSVECSAKQLLDSMELDFEYQVFHPLLVSPDFSFGPLDYAENVYHSSRIANGFCHLVADVQLEQLLPQNRGGGLEGGVLANRVGIRHDGKREMR